MNEHALKVVEAVRHLNLNLKDGKTVIRHKAFEAANALEALRLALEDFDHNTSHGERRHDLDNRPDFASPPQLDDPEFALALENSPDLLPSAVMELSLDTPEANLASKKEMEQKQLPVLPKPVLAAAVMSSLAAKHGHDRNYDLGDEGVFYDGDESAHYIGLAVEAIGDKLAFAVNKVGWTPRLRRMALALQLANQHVSIEIDKDLAYAKVPAHFWGELNVAVAEAALDQDLSIALPQPKPMNQKKKDLEYRLAPKPPQDW